MIVASGSSNFSIHIPELVEQILSFLDLETAAGIRTLWSCSQTSRLLRHTAKRISFRTIHLYDGASPSHSMKSYSFEAFYSLILSCCNGDDNVLSLTKNLDIDLVQRSPSGEARNDIIGKETILNILRSMTGMSSITINPSAPSPITDFDHWASICHAVKDTGVKVVRWKFCQESWADQFLLLKPQHIIQTHITHLDLCGRDRAGIMFPYIKHILERAEGIQDLAIVVPLEARSLRRAVTYRLHRLSTLASIILYMLFFTQSLHRLYQEWRQHSW
jgi:hypothetical protein